MTLLSWYSKLKTFSQGIDGESGQDGRPGEPVSMKYHGIIWTLPSEIVPDIVCFSGLLLYNSFTYVMLVSYHK